MATKKVLTEDFYPEGATVPTFRAGDEVDEVHVKMYGLEDIVVGAKTKTARRLRGELEEEEEENVPLGSSDDEHIQDTGVGK